MGEKGETGNIPISELLGVLHEASELSIVEKRENFLNYDFDLCSPLLEKHNLLDSVSFSTRRSRQLPLNSERHIYDLYNVIIRNLDIALDDRSGFQRYSDWGPISDAKWHFENCRFKPQSPNMWSFNLPWTGSFRFWRNEFDFGDASGMRSWIFVFQNGSRVLFQRNNFVDSNIQVTHAAIEQASKSVDSPPAEPDTSRITGYMSFEGNFGISSINLLGGGAHYNFIGTNRVNLLSIFDLRTMSESRNVSVYFGPREKVDPHFHHCFQHRGLFLRLRNEAATNQDQSQLRILDKHLDRIEYFLNKKQSVSIWEDWRGWIEYWQDRLLYGWRRWSSNFYKSWWRPLGMIAVGYMASNGVPTIFIEGFSLANWIDFNLRPVSDIPDYADSLQEMFGKKYVDVSYLGKSCLRLVGIAQVIWIAIWGFAFAKAVKR